MLHIFYSSATSNCLNDTSSDGSLNESTSDDNNGMIIALTTTLVIFLIGLVISVVINVFFVVKQKQSRYVI